MITREDLAVGGVFTVQCFDSAGNLKWEDLATNKVVNQGLNHILNTEFASGAQITSWYVGITGSAPTPAAGDTITGAHAGWTENASYSQATRPAFTVVTTTTQSLTNAAAVASFTINGTTTVGGAFIVSNNTISGTTGTLFSVAAFSAGDKSCTSGDTINCTYTISAASST